MIVQECSLNLPSILLMLKSVRIKKWNGWRKSDNIVPYFPYEDVISLYESRRYLCKIRFAQVMSNNRFSDDWSTFYSQHIERPKRTAIGNTSLTIFTGIGNIPAMGNS